MFSSNSLPDELGPHLDQSFRDPFSDHRIEAYTFFLFQDSSDERTRERDRISTALPIAIYPLHLPNPLPHFGDSGSFAVHQHTDAIHARRQPDQTGDRSRVDQKRKCDLPERRGLG